ncbi:hypothetical protein LINPERPRIM_LOCUS26435 [Linum perenne]
MSLHISAIVFIPLLVTSAFTGSTHAAATYKSETDDHHILYVVTIPDNRTAGGARFNAQIGGVTAAETMHAATTFTWSILNQTNNPSERKNVSIISLVIEDMPGNTPAHTSNISIHLNSNFIGNYTGNLRRQFNGIIYQEVAGIWQWDGEGKAPRGLASGIASYVRLKARYGTSKKVKPGEGERWDEGEGVTARFLVYCSKLKRGFVGEMNKKMRHGYTDGLFVELLGKRVELLWSNYKERYGHLDSKLGKF